MFQSSRAVLDDLDLDSADARVHGADRTEDEVQIERSLGPEGTRIAPLLPESAKQGPSGRLICAGC